MKRIIILTMAFVGMIVSAKAQTISVSLTDSSDVPGWTQQQALPTCVGTNYLAVKVKNTSGVSTGLFTLVLKPNASLIFSGGVAPCETWGISNDSLKIEFPGIAAGDSCKIFFVMQIPCTVNVPLSITKSILTGSSVIITANTPDVISYKHPKMLLDSFQTAAGVNMDDNYVQGQILAPETFRRFIISVTDGMLNHFSFNYLPETEIQWHHFEMQAFTNNVAVSGVVYYDVNTPVPDFDTTVINSFFGRKFMINGDKIKVKEYFKVGTCTPLNVNDGTSYSVTWHCYNQSLLGCNTVTKVRKMEVKQSTGNPSISLESFSPYFRVCGDTAAPHSPTTLTYKITNVHAGDPGTAGSDINSIHKIYFPLDTSWFTYQGIELVSDMGETITNFPPGFMIFYHDTCMLNFDTLTSPLFTNNSPVVDTFLTDGIYNELITNRFFRLVFKRCTFHCHGNSGNKTLYDDPKAGDVTAGFFAKNNGNTARVIFSRMCSGIITSPYSMTWFRYNHAMETIVESDKTDVEPMETANIDYYFSVIENPFWSYNFGSTNVFNSPSNQFYPVMEVSRLYTLDSVKYYQDANSTSFVFVQKQFKGLTNVGDSIFKLQSDSMVNHLTGRLVASVRLTNCPVNTGGFDTFAFKHYTVADSCDACAFNMRSNPFNLYHHCRGGCAGISPVATTKFNFDRISLGWKDSVMNLLVDTPAVKIKYNRVYPCDSIVFNGSGIVANSPGVGYPRVDSLYFQIEYPSLNNYQYYDFLSGYYLIHNNTTNITDSLPISNGQLAGNWNSVNCTSCVLKITIPNTINAQQLSLDGASLKIHAIIKVKNTIPVGTINNFPMPQIRAQYIAVDSSHTAYTSCDSWGDNMLFMNVQTNWQEKGLAGTSSVIKPENWATEIYNFPYYHSMCERRFTVITGVTGGYNKFDDFPGEFRPITLWPDTSKQDTLKIKFPPDLVFSSANFKAFDIDPVFKPINYSYGTATHELKIFGYNGHGWPIVDHNGYHQITFVLSGQLTNECPPEYRRADTIVRPDSATVIFPYKRRAYSKDAGCVDQDHTTYHSVYSTINYSLKMKTPVDTFKLYSNVDSLMNINLLFYDSTGAFSPQMNNVWVYPLPNPYCTITQVKQQFQYGNQYLTQYISALPTGFYPLGQIAHNVTHAMTFKIRIDSCTIETPFEVKIVYGFGCTSYPDSINHTGACRQDTLTLLIQPKSSGLSLDAFAPAISTVSSCDTITYTATMTSYAEAEAEYPLIVITNPPGLQLVAALCTTTSAQYPGGNLPIITNGDSCTIDLNATVYNGNGMPGRGHVATLTFKFVPLCSAASGTFNINFNPAVRNICNGDIVILNDSLSRDVTINRTLVDLAADLSIVPSFTNCSNPLGLNIQLNSIQHNGNVKLQGSISLPAGFTYNSSTVTAAGSNPVNWTQQFNSSSASAGINFNIPSSWCGPVPIAISVLLIDSVNCAGTVNCIDSLFITRFDTIFVCCDTCNLSVSTTVTNFTCSTAPNGAVTVNVSNGHPPYLFNWDNGYTTQTITGLLPGTYTCVITDSIGCTDSITAVVNNLDTIQLSITPADTVVCTNSQFTLTATGCSDCTYLWQPGGETTQSITVTVATDIQFIVTATTADGCRYDAYSNIKVIDCKEENICMYVYNRNYKDEAKDIERTDDDGYIVVGTMYTTKDELDAYVIKYDNNFNVQFAEKVGKQSQASDMSKERANAVIQADDFYYFTGSVQVSDLNTDVYVVKMDNSGNLVWAKRYGGEFTEVGTGIHLLRADHCRHCGNDELVVTGYSNGIRGGNKYQFMAMKIDPANGNIIKQRTYDIQEAQYSKSNASILLDDGESIVMAGEGAATEAATEKHIVVLKIDSDLNYVNNNTITNDFHEDVAYNLIQRDHSIYVLGRTNIQGDNTQDIYLVQFSDDLVFVLNNRTYGFHETNETGYGICLSDDRELVISGNTLRNGSYPDALVLKVDHKNLNTIGELIVKQPFNQTFYSNTMSADGSYIFTGVWGISDQDEEIFISRIDQEGEGCCYEKTKLNTFSQFKDWKVHFTTMEPKFDARSDRDLRLYYDLHMICGSIIKSKDYVKSAESLVPDNSIRLYPNPNNGTFELAFGRPNKEFTVNLYDLQGRNAFRKDVKNNQGMISHIDAHACDPGFYFVEIITGNKKWIGKIMIRH